MKKVVCTVNADQVGDDHKHALESAFRSNYARHLSPRERLTIIWCELPADQGFTNYEQPCVSLVVIEAKDGLGQAAREAMLSACAADWARITGVSSERLMISVFDETQFAVSMAANRGRMSLWGRIRFAAHMATSLLRSRATRGLLAFNPNLGG